MVTKREKAKDFAFMFKCIRDALKTIYEFDYQPDTLLGDYAQLITNKKMKKFWKNSKEGVIEISSLIKTFYLMTMA